MLAAVSIFTLASLGCLLATDIWGFPLFRMLQGAIISGYAVSMAVIRDMTPARKAASLMGYVAVGWALGPMLGPLLGGALDAAFGWRASFVAFVAFGAGVLAHCGFASGETHGGGSQTIPG